MSARTLAAALACLGLGLGTPVAAQEARSCAPGDLAALDGWKGIWIAEDIHTDINGRELPGAPPMPLAMKLLGLQAPWSKQGWERFEREWSRGVGGSLTGAGWSFPVMMSSPAAFKFVISPGETVIASQYRDIRYVYTDGSGHPPEDELWPTSWGDSIGCWEGGVLTVDTVGVRYSPAYNPFAPPLSEDARFVERYRLTGPDRLEADFTITDPATLEQPWLVHMVYRRHPVLTRLVHDGDSFENDRFAVTGEAMTIVDASPRTVPPPRLREAARLSAAELDRVAGRYAVEGAPIELVISRRGEQMFARVEPVFPIDLPIHPSGPLTYFSQISPETYGFETDAQGRVTGVSGTSPQGVPVRATRKAD